MKEVKAIKRVKPSVQKGQKYYQKIVKEHICSKYIQIIVPSQTRIIFAVSNKRPKDWYPAWGYSRFKRKFSFSKFTKILQILEIPKRKKPNNTKYKQAMGKSWDIPVHCVFRSGGKKSTTRYTKKNTKPSKRSTHAPCAEALLFASGGPNSSNSCFIISCHRFSSFGATH